MYVPLIVLGLALALKTIDAVHVVRLVVSTVEEEAAWSQHLVSVQEQCDFARPRASIDEVTIEQVPVLVTWRTIPPEQLHKIEVLTCFCQHMHSIVLESLDTYREYHRRR